MAHRDGLRVRVVLKSLVGRARVVGGTSTLVDGVRTLRVGREPGPSVTGRGRVWARTGGREDGRTSEGGNWGRGGRSTSRRGQSPRSTGGVVGEEWPHLRLPRGRRHPRGRGPFPQRCRTCPARPLNPPLTLIPSVLQGGSRVRGTSASGCRKGQNSQGPHLRARTQRGREPALH